VDDQKFNLFQYPKEEGWTKEAGEVTAKGRAY